MVPPFQSISPLKWPSTVTIVIDWCICAYMHIILIFATSHSGYRIDQVLYDKDKDQDDHDKSSLMMILMMMMMAVAILRVPKVWTLCAAAEETIGKSSSQCSCLLLLDAKYQMDKSYIVARRSTKYQMKKISQFSNPSGHIDLRSIESKFI